MRSPLLVAVALWSGCASSNHAASDVSKHAVYATAELPADWTLASLANEAKFMGNLGKVHRTVSHRDREAQELFDQGLALTYAFNYDEAVRSFARAAEIDATCALCLWGVSYTLGPNYNRPYLEGRAALAWQAYVTAEAVAAAGATPVERALIEALGKRYGGHALSTQRPDSLKRAYADAMGKVARAYPDDYDVQTLYADALMQLRPYRLYDADGVPTEETKQVVQILERVMRLAPNHAGANHLYIHAVEASPMPERGLTAAVRLPGLVPAVGHLVHKPSRIFQRVGRYADAAEANRHAIRIDLDYVARQRPHGDSRAYLRHSYGYLAFAAAMLGRRKEAVAAARAAAERTATERPSNMPGRDLLHAAPLLVWVRFGIWQAIEDEPRPRDNQPVRLAFWLHAQGMACAAHGDAAGAREYAAAIRKLEIGEAQAGEEAPALLQRVRLAAQIVDARAAEVAKQPDALEAWREAVALEDALAYAEPDRWFYPVRHYYGSALLDAGHAKEAERVFREDLERHPLNGWALFGLSLALAKQKKAKPAREAEQAFKEAFKYADIDLARTAF